MIKSFVLLKILTLLWIHNTNAQGKLLLQIRDLLPTTLKSNLKIACLFKHFN